MKHADVIIHVSNQTSPKQRDELLNQLKRAEGVVSQTFSKEKKHLLLIEYDPKATNSSALLNRVKEKGFESQLVDL